MIDIGLKAADRATALAFLESAGLCKIVPASKGTPEQITWTPGVAYDEANITIVIKPAVYSQDAKTGMPTLVSPAEVDPNYHANIRLYGQNEEALAAKLEKGGTVRASLTLAKASDEVSAKTKAIANRTVSGVTLFRLGADGVKTPSRMWL